MKAPRELSDSASVASEGSEGLDLGRGSVWWDLREVWETTKPRGAGNPKGHAPEELLAMLKLAAGTCGKQRSEFRAHFGGSKNLGKDLASSLSGRSKRNVEEFRLGRVELHLQKKRKAASKNVQVSG